MFQLFSVSYKQLITGRSEELFMLRKKTFSDRLNWDVKCLNNMEIDEFDGDDTQYILGVYRQQIICSTRLIPLDKPNMITHTFSAQFGDVPLPGNLIESSRFFVDKSLCKQLLGDAYPVSYCLYLALINYGIANHLDSLYTIVSKSMLAILRRTGWRIRIVKEAYLTPKEPIYLLHVPTDKASQAIMAPKAGRTLEIEPQALLKWPLTLPVSHKI
ncbi:MULTISPECIES: acyl-homoserine-lactone synthase [Tenebrionibacter/Tenebrionicola group]|jgi:N-acyl-L-homoserine lactone synthetase|uniref:Acyl-homoserine-lactone synthase n=2 Tax=Tenebrionibacter/Tenebrionicola group TaxID=2969848 RepID=A0A8K0XWT8_9ENTR|nr:MULTISPECIES: acyl-homoserine-lactone synthase [Tenebrionibacter/Tenebrionicola group]MBK4715815.1 acyl-homoserine-lactone synthase [Tenebrionibacter intestinalis]MBV4412786.1 acyl-homoserine-lactone synthase [Tenebrionicola larvae]MBV5096513.1 acyl-homoserine-lactone synthase [Tenebrionicola larvae]